MSRARSRWSATRSGNVTEAFTPDFYLPDQDLYVELTTMQPNQVRHKNRKLRRLQELYPDVNIKLFKRGDIRTLMLKFGVGLSRHDGQRVVNTEECSPMQASSFPSPNNDPNELTRDISRVLFTQEEIHQRIGELGSTDQQRLCRPESALRRRAQGRGLLHERSHARDHDPGAHGFHGDLTLCPAAAQAKGPVRLIKDLDETVDGQHLIFVEDVIDTGLTLSYLLRILKTRSPASLEVCTLFDKKEHRLVNTPVRYKGFDLPYRFVVGYGLDYREGYRHLPFVGELRPELLNLA